MEPEGPIDDINSDSFTTRFEAAENFNVDTIDDAELDRLGLPRRPDPDLYPEAFAFWKQLIRPPLQLVKPYFEPYDPSENFLHSGGVAAQTRQQTSRNWSGASITPRDGRMFTEVSGSWRVPSVWATANGEYRSSTWIGLDGQRSYLDATLPQIGTAQQVVRTGGTSTVKTSCWVQWWPGIDEYTIPDLIFGVDDEVGANVLVLPPKKPGEPERVRLYIVNLTAQAAGDPHPYSNWEWKVPKVGYPDPKQPPFLQPHVGGATAEWVMECPTKPCSEELWPFPSYHHVAFTGCHASSAVTLNEIGTPERITGPTLIRMYKVDPVSGGTTVISVARRTGEHEFETAPPPP
jgi:hypothetical protein